MYAEANLMLVVFQSTPSGGKATRFSSLARSRGFVSIHAFRGEGDRASPPRPPETGVSIHAFRGEGDGRAPVAPPTDKCFNPRLPGGRRRGSPVWRAAEGLFQSTPSGGKATSSCTRSPRAWTVSIHAFRGEGDADAFRNGLVSVRFQSTPSGGKATS